MSLDSFADQAGITARLETTTKLLSKFEKEFDSLQVKTTDPLKILEMSKKALQTYELCAQEFSYEMESIQLYSASLFFQQFMQGYHKQTNFLLKFSLEKFQDPGQITIQPNAEPQNISNNSFPSMNKEFNNGDGQKGNLFEDFQKISQKTKIHMENDAEKNNKNANNIKGGEVLNSKQEMFLDRQNNTIHLLRTELNKQQKKTSEYQKEWETVKKKHDVIEVEKRNLEDELIRLIKKERLIENDEELKNIAQKTKINNLNKNAIKKENTFNNKNKQNQNEVKKAIVTLDPIDEYLRNVAQKKREEENKPKIEEKKEEEVEVVDEHDKMVSDEIKEILEKKGTIYSNIKDSGVAKELKQVLRKIATQKNRMSLLSNDMENERFQFPDSDEENRKKGIHNNHAATKEKKVLFPKLRGKQNGDESQARSSIVIKTKGVEKSTQPDPYIFDIQIIDAQKFNLEKLKIQLRTLEQKYTTLESNFKSKEEENKRLDERLSIDKKTILENEIKYSGFEHEKNILRQQLKDEQMNSAFKDEKLAKKKFKIDVLKETLAKFTNDGKALTSNISKAKNDQLEAKLEMERLKTEIRQNKQNMEEMNSQKEKSFLEILALKDSLLVYKDEIEVLKSQIKILNENISLIELQTKLTMEQNEDLVALLNQNEEGKASLMKYRNSVIYLDSLAKFQGSKSTVSQNAMNVESLNKHMQAQKIASAQKINSKQVSANKTNLLESPSPSHLLPSSRKPTVDEKAGSSSRKPTFDETSNSISRTTSKYAKNIKNQSTMNLLRNENMSSNNNNNNSNINDNNSKMNKSTIKMDQSKKSAYSLSLNSNTDNPKIEKSLEENNIIETSEISSSSLQSKLEKEIKLRKSAEKEVVVLKEKINFLKKEMGEHEVEKKLDFFNKNLLPIVQRQDSENALINDQIDKIEYARDEGRNEKGEDDLRMRNGRIKTQKRNNDIENITLDSHYESLVKESDYFFSPKNSKISNDMENSFKKTIFLSKSTQPKHLKRNNLNNLDNNQAISLQSLTKSQEGFSIEEKNNVNEMEALYESLKNIKLNNNNSNNNTIDNDNRNDFTDILKNIMSKGENGSLNFEEFKKAMDAIKQEHKKCGSNCIHLMRFYKKVGHHPNNKRPIYQLHKNTINKLPKIKSYKLVS